MATLGDKNVGDIVKIKENGIAVNYIIVHKGKPSDLYDDSCDGVWLFREKTLEKRAWHGTSKYTRANDYENSDIEAWLNGDFLNTIDEKIREVIKTVKIPFKKGLGKASTGVYSGANGLSCKAFLLSGYEVGFDKSYNQYFPVDGANLSYFSDRNSRIGKDSTDTAVDWWLRSPMTGNEESVFYVKSNGLQFNQGSDFSTIAVRPALILPSSLSLSLLNSAPTIVSDKSGDLGTIDSGFTCTYSVDDADAEDNVTVSLKMDDNEISSFSAVKQQNETYTLEGNDWLKITDGTHSFTINASDGFNTTTNEIVFTRDCKKTVFSLESPMTADDVISVCSLKIKGLIATDTILTCEVTNNANDTIPVWEDCTVKVKTEMVYAFKNQTAENGFAFNFKISAQRGASGAGGYITSIEGGFG